MQNRRPEDLEAQTTRSATRSARTERLGGPERRCSRGHADLGAPWRRKPAARFGLALALASALASPLASPLAAQDEPPADLALVGAHVIPMDRDTVLEDRVVLIRDGLIAQITTQDRIELDADVRQVDCRGHYLLPALADMHVHLERLESELDLLLFIVHGVTAVRAMDGRPVHLDWRRRVENGELLGPRITTAGPIIDGRPAFWDDSISVAGAEEARSAVRAQKEAGYDFIKIYHQLSKESFEAVMEEARDCGLPVDGHVPRVVGLSGVLGAGMRCIEHLRGYPEAVESERAPLHGRWHWSKLYFRVECDETKIESVARRTVTAGAWNCPTLIVNENHVPIETMREWMADPDLGYLPRSIVDMWDPASWDEPRRRRLERMDAEDFAMIAAGNATARRMVERLHEAGAGIILGTDTPNPFVVPGRSVHRELELFVRAGLSPFEALRTATVEAARFLGETETWGTIEPGRRADLLLIRADPLQDITATRRIAGLCLGGRWLSRRDLDQLLERLRR